VIRRRVRATGRVQGVFFRDGVRVRARSEGVSGWARNCSDGSLEAVFEGEPAAVERLIEFCRTGPEGARVEALEVVDESPEQLTGFEVRG
jgi:acylphosphatase